MLTRDEKLSRNRNSISLMDRFVSRNSFSQRYVSNWSSFCASAGKNVGKLFAGNWNLGRGLIFANFLGPQILPLAAL